MTVSKICEEIMDESGKYQQYLRKIPEHWRPDLLQEVMVILLEDQEKLVKAYNEKWLLYLFVNICQKQFHSSTSPFYKKYRQITSEFNESTAPDEKDTDIERKERLELEFELTEYARKESRLTWFQDRIAKQYFDDNLSMAKVAQENDISTASVFNCIHKILNIYRDTIESKIN